MHCLAFCSNISSMMLFAFHEYAASCGQLHEPLPGAQIGYVISLKPIQNTADVVSWGILNLTEGTVQISAVTSLCSRITQCGPTKFWLHLVLFDHSPGRFCSICGGGPQPTQVCAIAAQN